MNNTELAQWVISNRYPKSEKEKVSDFEMYNFIIDNLKQPESNGWISVSERLPEDDNIVCVFNNNMVILSCYYKGNWYRDDGYLIHPTHWQPLPPPPAKH